MRHALLVFAACAFAVTAAAPAAKACDDNTDAMVAKLQKLDLTTNQLKAIFSYQAEHKAFIQSPTRKGSAASRTRSTKRSSRRRRSESSTKVSSRRRPAESAPRPKPSDMTTIS